MIYTPNKKSENVRNVNNYALIFFFIKLQPIMIFNEIQPWERILSVGMF